MTDLITAEEAEKLLDGSTPGPWEWTTGRFSNNPYLSPNILLLAFDGGGPDGVDPNDAANARLIAAAHDLARTVIALHAQLTDAQAAQAMVVERCAEFVERQGTWMQEHNLVGNGYDLVQQGKCLRALAPIDGLALVRELRAERDQLRAAVEGLIAVLDRNGEKGPIPDVEMMFCWLAAQNVRAAFRNTEGRGDMTDDGALETLFAMANVQDGYAKKATDRGLKIIHKANAKAQREVAATINDLRARLASAEADRDRLAAANAVLEAKVAGLLDAIRDEMKTRSAYAVGSGGATTAREKFAAWSAASERLRVLATQEAGA